MLTDTDAASLQLQSQLHSQESLAATFDGGVQYAQATPQWYAAYTRSHHEKCVAEQLQTRTVEHFLPLYETVRRWKDRRKRMELPLFPGYIFVRVPLQERLRVLVIPGVVRLVGFDNRPVALPDGEMEALRTLLTRRLRTEPHP